MLPDVVVVLMTGYSDRMQEAQMVGARVLAKLKLSTNAELTRYALERGLLE